MDHPFYLTALALTFIFSFVLGIFTILLNLRSKVHWLWFLTTMGVAIWGGLLLIVIGLKMDNDFGILLTRFLHIGALMLVIFFLHFLLQFLRKMREYKYALIIGYFVAVFFSIFIVTTDWIVAGVTPMMGFNVWLNPGKFFWMMVAYFLICSVISIRLLFKEYKKSDGILKKQIFYIFFCSNCWAWRRSNKFFSSNHGCLSFRYFCDFSLSDFNYLRHVFTANKN